MSDGEDLPSCIDWSTESVEDCISNIQAFPSATVSQVIGYDYGNKYCNVYFSHPDKPLSCPDGWDDELSSSTISGTIDEGDGNADFVCYTCTSPPPPSVRKLNCCVMWLSGCLEIAIFFTTGYLFLTLVILRSNDHNKTSP